MHDEWLTRAARRMHESRTTYVRKHDRIPPLRRAAGPFPPAPRPGISRSMPRLPLRLAPHLALLVLWPVAWSAPLLRTGLLPFLEGTELSVLSTVAALWPEEALLAALVALFGIAAPYAKTLALAAFALGRLPRRWAPALDGLAKLSMADVFLVALAIVVAKGVGLGRLETAWGLPLFAGCVLASLALSILEGRRRR